VEQCGTGSRIEKNFQWPGLVAAFCPENDQHCAAGSIIAKYIWDRASTHFAATNKPGEAAYIFYPMRPTGSQLTDDSKRILDCRTWKNLEKPVLCAKGVKIYKAYYEKNASSYVNIVEKTQAGVFEPLELGEDMDPAQWKKAQLKSIKKNEVCCEYRQKQRTRPSRPVTSDVLPSPDDAPMHGCLHGDKNFCQDYCGGSVDFNDLLAGILDNAVLSSYADIC